ncbi:MAG TPA: hypothetical protein VGM30_01265 [Puia sp.]
MSNRLLRVGGTKFLLIETPIVVVLTVMAVVLNRNITMENAAKKKWVMGMIRGSGVRSVVRAIGYMKEIEDFKKEG